MSSASAFFMFEVVKIAKGDGMKYNDLKSLEEINNLNHLNVKDIVNDNLNNLKKA